MTTRQKLTDDEALALLEGIDPETSPVRDRSATADIRAAVQMRDAAAHLVDKAVLEARKSGLTWVEVAAALDVSPQAARQKYLKRT